MYSQPKEAGPYEQPVQDNIKKGTHSKKKKDLIQEFTYRKERILYSARTTQRCMKLAREMVTALLWEESPP